MKILVLSNLYPPHYVGGYELYCKTVVDELRSRGHSVHVLTSDHQQENSTAPLKESRVTRSLKIHGLMSYPFVGIGRLQMLELHNNRVLASMVRQLKPHLVYVWNVGGLSKSMLFTLQRMGIPTVFAVSDHWIARSEEADVWLNWWNRRNGRPRQRALRALGTWSGYRRFCQKIAPTNPIHQLQFPRIHFCSRALQNLTSSSGFEVQHGEIIYLPVDIRKFFAGRRSSRRPLQRLLYVGRLHEDKGVMTALRALALVRDKFPGQFSIYGTGDAKYRQKLMSFVQEEQLPVTFNAVYEPEKMPDIYQAHDALIFPSEWIEPFAMTPLEAMACGLAVIGTTTGGSAELFRHQVNCLTYPAGDAAELAERILKLDSNNPLREKLARTGQAEVRRRFAVPVIVDQIETYLKETLALWQPIPLPAYDA